MAFQLKISAGERMDTDGKIIYVKDITGNIGDVTYTQSIENGSTTYTSVTNSTGYGAPNPLRSSLALFLIPYIKKTTGNVFLKTKDFNPVTVTEFEVLFTEDGWYNFDLLKFNAVASPDATTYTEGDLVYDTTQGKVVKKSGSVFVVETDLTKYIDNTTYSVTASEKPVVFNNSKIKTSLNVEINNHLFNDKRDLRAIRNLQERYDLLRGLLEGAVYQFCIGNKTIFQKMVEFMNTNDFKCDC